MALSKFELRNSKKAVFPLGFMLIVYAFLMISSAPQLVDSLFYDVFFLIYIGMAASWAKPKEFQLNKTKDGSWISPYFVLLHQLPIRREVLIKNRFVVHYVYSIPANVLFLGSIYAFSETIRTILTFPEYAAFTIIWLSFGIYWGTAFPLTEVGEVKKMGSFKMWLYTVLFLVVVVGGVTLLQRFTGYGVVYGSMLLAKNWPLLSSLLFHHRCCCLHKISTSTSE